MGFGEQDWAGSPTHFINLTLKDTKEIKDKKTGKEDLELHYYTKDMIIYEYKEYDRGEYGLFAVGEKVVYGEHGVCTVEKVAPLDMSGVSKNKL